MSCTDQTMPACPVCLSFLVAMTKYPRECKERKGWSWLMTPSGTMQGESGHLCMKLMEEPRLTHGKGGMDGGGVSCEHTSQRSRLSVLPLPARPPLHVTCSYELLIDEFSLPLPSTHSSFICQQYLAAETHILDSEAFWDISSPPKIPWLPLLLSGDTTDRAFQSLELKLPLPWKPAHDLSFLISNDDKTTLDCSLWDVAGGNIQEHAGTSPATSQRYTDLQGLQPRRMLCSAFYLGGFVQSTLGKMFGKC